MAMLKTVAQKEWRITLEREFALVRKTGGVASFKETRAFAALLGKMKGKIEKLGEIDEECAANSVEIKFPLIRKQDIAPVIRSFRSAVNELAETMAFSVIWTDQRPSDRVEMHPDPAHWPVFFPGLEDTWIYTNAIHIHFEIPKKVSPHMYNQMNAVAPWFVMNTADGEYDRLDAVSRMAKKAGGLYLPQDLRTEAEYYAFCASVWENFRKGIPAMDNSDVVLSEFNAWNKQKIFHPARIRPDFELPNGNISLEFRPMAGVADTEKEIRICEAAVYAFWAGLDAPRVPIREELRQFYFNPSRDSLAYDTAKDLVERAYYKNTCSSIKY
jgi:hypothetical protein